MVLKDVADFVTDVGMPTLVALWGLWVTTKLLRHNIVKREEDDDGKKDEQT